MSVKDFQPPFSEACKLAPFLVQVFFLTLFLPGINVRAGSEIQEEPTGKCTKFLHAH